MALRPIVVLGILLYVGWLFYSHKVRESRQEPTVEGFIKVTLMYAGIIVVFALVMSTCEVLDIGGGAPVPDDGSPPYPQWPTGPF